MKKTDELYGAFNVLSMLGGMMSKFSSKISSSVTPVGDALC